ncbi:MAG: Glu-tRNA(Gln) amidotransferase subunit GatD [Candidatus Diapherotrites archaeon]|nr:Glu-tRNA(Gln) amidotransferase subunit GatD [Candidatus Diapherotrites archaeon]
MDYKKVMKKFGVNEGEFVEIHSEGYVYEGYILPSSKKEFFTLKLKSGYNIGIAAEKVERINKLKEEAAIEKKVFKEIEKKENLPRITILHTGGTIASKVDYRTGAVVCSFLPEDLINMFPEISEIANLDSRLIANMWSDDLRFKHISMIAKAIKEEVEKGVDGIIIGIGTDNLAPAAAGLAFALENLPIAVILVGAQRSSDRGSSDAAVNIISAANFIIKSDFSGVAICMHGSTSDDFCYILPSCKTKKMHSSARDAFKPINDTPIAKVEYPSGKIEFYKKDYIKKDKNRKLILKENFEEKVGLLKITPNMFPEQFSFYRKNKFKGLVIEGTGLGHTPAHVPNQYAKIHKKIYEEIKKLTKSGCIVIMTTTCLQGRVNMNVYNKGRDLQEAGIISGEDMLAEVAFMKLSWLLGNFEDRDKIKEMISKNLRGEIRERTLLNVEKW